MLPNFATTAPRDYLSLAPEPRIFLWELPFWAVLLYCALTPGSVSPWWTIGDVPLRSSEGTVLLAGLWFGLCGFLSSGRRWLPTALSAFVAAIAWGFVSCSWNGLEGEDLQAMRLTLALGLGAAITAWGLIAGQDRQAVHHFLWRITAFLAVLSLLYAAESIFSLGLRSELGQNTLLDFGIERVKGPLFGSSTGYLVLLPALAFAVHHAIYAKERRILAIAMVLALLTALLGLGSRAAIVLLAVFLTMLSLLIKNVRKRLFAVALTLSLGVVAAMAIFSQASTERLQNLEDDTRRATHFTAWRTVDQTSWEELVRGAGYGGIWNWYLTDARNGDRLASGDNVIRTAMGLTLYHSHSTFLLMTMELGLPGLILFLALLSTLGRLVTRCWGHHGWQPLACGMLASGLGLFFDLFLFKNSLVNLVWWTYALGASALITRGQD